MKHWIAIGTLVLTSGCASTELYRWGSYEDVLYNAFTKPEATPVGAQLEMLKKDALEMRADGRRPFPGFHAHLGYLYMTAGMIAEAQNEFAIEKAAYPESSVLMDRFMKGRRQ